MRKNKYQIIYKKGKNINVKNGSLNSSRKHVTAVSKKVKRGHTTSEFPDRINIHRDTTS